MSTLTTIQSTDIIANSRTDINNNFSALNTDKEEVTNKSTDTAMTANSDTLYPSQKATKAYADSVAGANASETVKGNVEEATTAQITAGTDTGETGARTFVTPSKMNAQILALAPDRTAVTLVPQPASGINVATPAEVAVATNTTMIVGQVIVPFKIVVNKVSFRTRLETVSGTYDVSLYSEDGQTRLFSVTTGTVSGNDQMVTTAVSAVSINPGIYYIAINPNSTASTTMYFWGISAVPFSTTVGLGEDVTSEPKMQGTLTITAGTPPSTITPTSITGATNSTLIFRLDN